MIACGVGRRSALLPDPYPLRSSSPPRAAAPGAGSGRAARFLRVRGHLVQDAIKVHKLGRFRRVLFGGR